jgi:lipopolysaccharide export system permease protein
LPDSIFVLLGGRYVKVARNNIPDSAYYPGGIPAGKAAIAAERTAAPKTAPAATPGAQPQLPGGVPIPNAVTPTTNPTAAATSAHGPPLRDSIANSPEITDAKMRLEDTRHRRNRYGIEIQKKFSLAASCIVFVLVGAPLALRFPRGGVGLVIGASFFVFAVYYVGLIGGESLANKNIISPFWAMWADNIIFLIAGLILMARMGNESVTSRGGSVAERVDATRDWFARQGRRVRFRRRLGEST